jgi:hypothetical protein
MVREGGREGEEHAPENCRRTEGAPGREGGRGVRRLRARWRDAEAGGVRVGSIAVWRGRGVSKVWAGGGGRGVG